jgi:hypothetical protein
MKPRFKLLKLLKDKSFFHPENKPKCYKLNEYSSAYRDEFYPCSGCADYTTCTKSISDIAKQAKT